MATRVRPFSLLPVLALVLTAQALADPSPELLIETLSRERFGGVLMHLQIMHRDEHAPPEVGLHLAGVDSRGGVWELSARTDATFLRTGKLLATGGASLDRAGTFRVVRRPLAGTTSGKPSGRYRQASTGQLLIRARDRTLEGLVSGMEASFDAWFEGPFTVSCSVPAPVSDRASEFVASDEMPGQQEDPAFAGALCAPWQGWKERSAAPPPRVPGQCDG